MYLKTFSVFLQLQLCWVNNPPNFIHSAKQEWNGSPTIFLIVSVPNKYVIYNLTALFLSIAPNNVETVMDEITR